MTGDDASTTGSRRRLLSVLLLLLPAGATPLHAQQPGTVALSVWGGPHTVLGAVGLDLTQSETRLESSAALGGSVEVGLPVSQLSVRLEGMGVLGTEMVTEYALGCPVPPRLTLFTDACRAASDGSYLLGAVNGVYRTSADPTEPQGVFIVGIGVKRYDYSTEPTMTGLGSETFRGPCRDGDFICEIHVEDGYAGTNTDPAVHLGFGFTTRAGRVRLGVEVSDYISGFDHVALSGRTVRQAVHDLVLKLRLEKGFAVF